MLWNASYETGIAKIDEQHKELFRAIDNLLDVKNKGRVKEMLDYLGAYIVKHFTDEQQLHVKAKYPKAAAHRAFHDNYVKVFNQLKAKFENEGATLAMTQAVNKSVVGWLTEHIMVHDKEFAAYCRANNIKG
ncbi:hemerythrin [Synergistales bacterium]|nr:hemerythrin [Synergistales bacterium]